MINIIQVITILKNNPAPEVLLLSCVTRNFPSFYLKEIILIVSEKRLSINDFSEMTGYLVCKI